MNPLATLFLSAALLATLAPYVSGALVLPSIISDHMLLQRGSDVPIWGWDTPGTTVTVDFRDHTATATAQADGKWLVRVPPGEAGGPFVLRIKGSEEREVQDVLVGEVWVAGGQSNMWWHLGNCRNADAEAADADDPAIRVWDANTSPVQAGWPATIPQRTVQAQWKASSPAVARDFPGTPFFFARELRRRLGVPVGIVHLAVPGVEIETFLSGPFLRANLPQTLDLLAARRRLYAEDKADYDGAFQAWQARAAEAKAEHQAEPKPPIAPPDPNQGQPGCFFNGMIAPVVPYAARGFLWWQGESNAERALQYRVLFPGLIEEWRQRWGLPGAPFLFCELHSWLNPQQQPVEEDPWPDLRDAQGAALALPGVYEVCNLDILAPEEGLYQIHPANKQQAAHRLFLAAMANVYGDRAAEWSGPRFRAARFESGTATISFAHAEGGLVAKDGGELRGFALAGADRQWHWAEAKAADDEVTLTSPDVPRPVAARYAWANHPVANVCNRAGLPMFPFRTDAWNLGVPEP